MSSTSHPTTDPVSPAAGQSGTLAEPPLLRGGDEAASEPVAEEQLQTLIHQLTTRDDEQTAATRIVGITSCAAGEGVSTVTNRLVRSAARSLARPVLLVDATTSHRTLLSSVPSRQGYSEALAGEPLEDCAHATHLPHLHVMGPGSVAPPKGNQLESARRLHQRLREQFAMVVVDLPIVSDLTGHFPTASALDGVFLVIEAERLRRQVVIHAQEQLDQLNVRLTGVMLNKRQMHIPDWLYKRL